MVKVKQLKTKTSKKRAKITVGSLLDKVKSKLHEERIEAISKIMREKYRQLEEAQIIVDKITAQIEELEDKDIMEVDLDEYDY